MDPEDGRNDGQCVGNGNVKGSEKRSEKEEKEEADKSISHSFLFIQPRIRFYSGLFCFIRRRISSEGSNPVINF